jgi:uncharacterized protein YbbC (DUF1343 family)
METLTGLDCLIRDAFRPLAGAKVGLITNHTGLTLEGVSAIDAFHHAPGLDLVRLFSPEHGIRGLLDEKVSDSVDDRTGLPIVSLYGTRQRPAPEHLKGLDTLVFDIQDIGCRYYTYISTLGNCLEEAARAGLRFVVLDRPNPIGGTAVEGPISDDDQRSFTAWHPIPVRHGMTVGEIARFFNQERAIGANLTVIRVEGWERRQWLDQTGLYWTNPSPNMRSLTQAALYPGVGLLETTNLSVGRGTDTPFEMVGAPWLDGRAFAIAMNRQGLPGVRFVPVRFVPRSSVFSGERCVGVNILIVDRARFSPVRTGIAMAAALRSAYPSQWKAEAYGRLLANRQIHQLLLAGASPNQMELSWREGLERFKARRRRYLLYA